METATKVITLREFLANEALEGVPSYKQVLNSLDDAHKAAVLFESLDNQVQNGGFQQWHENKYSDEIDLLFYFLNLIGTESAQEVTDQLEQFQNVFYTLQDIDKETDPDDYELHENYDEPDYGYNEIREAFLSDLNYFLASIQAE